MGLGNQAEGGLLVVVVVVHYAQVHGKDGCGGGGHLHGQCCRAHVHWRRRPEREWERRAAHKHGVCLQQESIYNANF